MNIKQKNGETNMKMIFATLVVAVVIIFGATMYTPGTHPKIITPNLAMETGGNAVLGSEDAPVTMVVFGDYQCPFCKKAFDTAEAQVRREYVDTGKVKIVFRDYPLDAIHPYARKASEAAQCAQPQGKYWEYHDALYEKQDQLATLDYVKLAGDLGLDAPTFKVCFDNGTYANEVEQDKQAGDALHVQGTPASFINGTLIPGAYPYENYKEIIEKALKAA